MRSIAAVSIDLWPRPALAACTQEVADQIADVLQPLAQRRHAERHDVQAVEQVLAEQALLDLRSSDSRWVAAMMRTSRLDRRAPADGGVLALLQHAQQPRLRVERHVADLVEEQRAALGLLEAALACASARR